MWKDVFEALKKFREWEWDHNERPNSMEVSLWVVGTKDGESAIASYANVPVLPRVGELWCVTEGEHSGKHFEILKVIHQNGEGYCHQVDLVVRQVADPLDGSSDEDDDL